jgi:hypothetical protein
VEPPAEAGGGRGGVRCEEAGAEPSRRRRWGRASAEVGPIRRRGGASEVKARRRRAGAGGGGRAKTSRSRWIGEAVRVNG